MRPDKERRPPVSPGGDAAAAGDCTSSAAAEAHLRAAARLLEYAGVTDPEAERLAHIVFRLAQRLAVDCGRLERAA